MKHTIVLKIGTSSICDEKTHFPKLSSLSLLVETIVNLIHQGNKVILVTSGAVGVGLRRLNLNKKPKHLSQIQVLLSSLLFIYLYVSYVCVCLDYITIL